MESAVKGIQLGEKEKSGFVEAVGWIRLGHAKVLQDPFDLTRFGKILSFKPLSAWKN